MKRVKTIARLTLFLAGLLLFSGADCEAASQPVKSGQWNAFVEAFMNSYLAAHPDRAVRAGRHEYDGKLPDWSRPGLQREIARLRAERDKALAFDPAVLDKRQHFEREYLLAVIDRNLFWLGSAGWPYRNPYFYESALNPNVYLTRPYAPLEQRMRAYIDYVRAVPAAAGQIRDNLKPPLARNYLDIGLTIFGGLAVYYETEVPAAFAAVKDQRLQKEFRTANAAAAQAMRGLAAWLETQRATASDDFALGAERFREMLWMTERVDVPLENLEKAGREDLERNLAALRAACAAYAPGKTIQACVAMVQAKKPKGGAVEVARRQLHELKAFVAEKKLMTIPGTEEALVAEAPPYKRFNPAYIDIPGPYEKGLPSVYYIAPPDPSWSLDEQSAYIPGMADLLFISAHEVWPGHFLQFLHANRSPSKFGQLFVGYAFAEGWAHYAEEMMWEAGLGNGDPETHIGQLLNALLRNVRFISAIGLHTGNMTLAESERMFRDTACQDPGNARQQAARGTFDPAYLNYTLGKLMIRKLRDDWTASRGGRAAWGAFHDRFLSYGGPPIPLVRDAMMGANLLKEK
ncbi:MAG TPA: DUF885 domain-containing protein [Dongiaceae bacterium]|nr:DUF885 domain-containing protein [Dongiaceae bacterium]